MYVFVHAAVSARLIFESSFFVLTSIPGCRDPRVQRAIVRVPEEPHDGDRTQLDGAGGRVGRRQVDRPRRHLDEPRQASRLYSADSGR